MSYIGKLNIFDDIDDNTNVYAFGLRATAARVTPDGKRLLFVSRGSDDLTGEDQGGTCGSTSDLPCRALYLFDADADGGEGALTCVSCSPSGAPLTADVDVGARRGTGGADLTPRLNRPLSADGDRVFFSTADALLPEDRNGFAIDVYAYDVSQSHLSLISSGKSQFNSYFMDSSASGDDVFFLTRDRLVSWDVDQNYDLYDARVGGGFPEPPLQPVPCSGADCQTPMSHIPSSSSSASEAIHSPGNLKPNRHRKRAKQRNQRHKRAKQRKQSRKQDRHNHGGQR